MSAAEKHEIERLRYALTLIAEGTVVPDAWPDVWNQLSEDKQAAMSAMLIARGALEGGNYQTTRETDT